jgi:hypothetical protein
LHPSIVLDAAYDHHQEVAISLVSSRLGAQPLVPPALVAIAGSYGSGKTEFAVNFALQLAATGWRVQIADLDIVNPYFRCREARLLMEHHGIRVVVPPGAQAWADLPIILPEIRGMLYPPAGTISIFDVGGDDVGARALSMFRPAVAEGGYDLWQVINARRPFTDTVAGCLQMRQSIESASRWTVTGLVVNTHLIDETTVADVMDGWRLGTEIRAATGLPIRGVGVMSHLVDALPADVLDAPILRMNRHMVPPWRPSAADRQPPLPAPRPVPIGRAWGNPAIASIGELHGAHRD